MSGNAPSSGRAVRASGAGGAEKAARGRVLIVEDDYLVCAQYEQVSTDAGHDIVGSVHTANEAIRVSEEARPDLVVMDVRLASSRDGIDAAIEIRRRLGIRSLFVTAYSDTAMRTRAAEAEPVDWLIKPVGGTQLANAVGLAIKALREQAASVPREQPKPSQTAGGPIRVLIVEDDMLHRMSLIALMQDRGFDTEAAANAQEALDIITSKAQLHVAIVDLGLPDMDGRALVAAARAIQPGLKVVYATGYAASAVPEAEADPLARFLAKPFDERHLAVVFESFGWPMPPRFKPPESEE